MKALKNPKAMIVISMVIFGTIAPFVRNVSVTSGELALYRALMAAVIIGIVFIVTKQKIDLKAIKKEIPLLLVSGIAMGFNWILLFEAYKYTTVSVATLSYYFAPVIVTVVCPFLFKEKMTMKQIICFIASTVGLVLVINAGGLSGGSDYIGILFGLGAAVLYATVILLNKFIKGVDGIQRTFLQFVAAIIVLVPYVAFTSGVTLGNMNATGWIYLLAVGIIHSAFAYCLYFSAIKEVPGQTAAILSYADPLVAVIISVTILGESITLMQLIGGILILGFTLLNEIELPRRKKS